MLEGARTVDTRPVKKRLDLFSRAHRAYVTAETTVERAVAAVRDQQGKLAELDLDQNDAVDALARALIGERLPRPNPFRPLGFAAPSRLNALGYGKQAAVMLRLAKAAAKRQGAAKATLQGAREVTKAAQTMQRELKRLPRLAQAQRAALARRDALAQPWESAFAALKRGARAAEDDGSKGLYAALFQRAARPAAPRRPAPAPVPAPPAPDPTP